MTVNDKLAVLMPVYNAGKWLAQSLASCELAAIAPDRYEIIVVDNCSSDGSVKALPQRTANGAPIHVCANSSNIGRVANWNRAVEIAIERGFRHITFLFAGDCWLPGSALSDLFDAIQEQHAAIAFAPFVVADGHGSFKCVSQRFHINGTSAVLNPKAFLITLINSGVFPLGPLQANIYRVDAEHRPMFDPSLPTRTDVEATLDFIGAATSQVVIGSAPFLEWREHAGRFHMSMGPARTIEDYMATFQRACVRTQAPVNYGRAKACVVLNSLRLAMRDAPVRDWPRLFSLIARCARRTPHRVDFFQLLETLWARFAHGRRLLQFG